MNVKFHLLFLIFLPALLSGQNPTFEYPRDTSFTVWSAGENIKKEFPEARPVKEFQGLNIQNEKDVVYYTLGERNLHADIFYPRTKRRSKLPAILLIHGGGWASGNKSHLVPLAQILAEQRFFTATVEYRLSPEAKYPAAITDLKTIVKWIKINSDKYNIDTTKIAVLGCSAGATLASFVGITGQNPDFISHETNSSVSDKVHAIINIDGILDFTDSVESAKDNDPLKPSAGARWFGYTYQQKPEIWIEASPINYAGEKTPPTLFINSALPRFHAGREEYIKILNQYQIYTEVHTIKNTPHPFWLFDPWFNQTWPKITRFLNQVFN
jgi:pectinesterase